MDTSVSEELQTPPLSKKLTRKELRLLKKSSGSNSQDQRAFHLKNFSPLTDNQSVAYNAFYAEKNLFMHGIAGTGKTFVSLYLAMNELIKNKETPFKKVVIVRSVVPTRDMGFLPGSSKEKSRVYEAPYYSMFAEMFGRSDAYEYMKSRGLVEFVTTSFLRGTTLSDCIVIVDETQNCTEQELDTVITRSGINCRMVFCGDFKQTDLIRDREKTGILHFMEIIRRMPEFEFVEFNRDDIVRSNLVKSYIVAKDDLAI